MTASECVYMFLYLPVCQMASVYLPHVEAYAAQRVSQSQLSIVVHDVWLRRILYLPLHVADDQYSEIKNNKDNHV